MNYLIIFFSLLFLGTPAENNTLTIKISNIKSIEGTLEIGLYNNEEHFLEEGNAYKLTSMKVSANQETVVFKNLPKGDYAVSMYHDKNDDTKCNKNFMGIPTEPYAFSNNFRPKFSAPTFKDCQFTLSADQTLTIKMGN